MSGSAESRVASDQVEAKDPSGYIIDDYFDRPQIMWDLLKSKSSLNYDTLALIEIFNGTRQEALQINALALGKKCLAELQPALPTEESKDEKLDRPAKARGVANNLSKYDKKQLIGIFNAWNNAANEGEKQDRLEFEKQWYAKGKTDSVRDRYCDRLRLLIAYYLPIDELKNTAQNPYQMSKVRQFLDFINHHDNDTYEFKNDPLLHAIKIKFAIADGRHVDAMELIRKSSLHINLNGANISHDAYRLAGINLANACMENVILGRQFILDPENGFLFPQSVEGANLKGAVLPDLYGIYARNLFIETFKKAQAGLDIRFGEKRRTLLHLNADNFNEPYYHPSSAYYIRSLLQNGADSKMVDSEGQLPCSAAMIKHEFILPYGNYIYTSTICYLFNTDTFCVADDGYLSLIATLDDKELKQQEELLRHHKNKFKRSVAIQFSLILFNLLLVLLMLGTVQISAIGSILFPIAACILPFSVLPSLYLFFRGLLTEQLTNIFIDSVVIEKTIAQRRLANTQTLQGKDYKIYLLFKEKHRTTLIETPRDENPQVPRNDFFTPEEKWLFDNLDKDDLARQVKLNNHIAKQDKANAKRFLITGLVFTAITAIFTLAALSIFIPALMPMTIPATSLATLAVSSIQAMAVVFSLLFTSATFNVFSKFKDYVSSNNAAKKAIDEMIQHKLIALQAAEIKEVPAHSIELEQKRAPQSGVKSMPTPIQQPQSLTHSAVSFKFASAAADGDEQTCHPVGSENRRSNAKLA